MKTSYTSILAPKRKTDASVPLMGERVRAYQRMPQGFEKVEIGASTPRGYEWIGKREGKFNYSFALLKKKKPAKGTAVKPTRTTATKATPNAKAKVRNVKKARKKGAK